MSIDEDRLDAYAEELYRALREARSVAPLTEREPAITLEDAYAIQSRLLERRRSRDGEQIVGKKIGVTSEVVMKMLDVNQPDFGELTQAMRIENGGTVPLAKTILARAEGEIAFVLARDLGPDCSPDDVLAATESVVACFEIVDSRIRDWKIRIQDTVADNASSCFFVLGEPAARPTDVDLVGCKMTLEKNGEVIGTGTGAATLGSPLRAVAWLANTLGRFGRPLKAGEVILSGSLGPLVPVAAGDRMRVEIEGLGSAKVSFR
jgi:2-oxopent-4-enoate/cis-2-oxohex-4-enoate hydratase